MAEKQKFYWQREDSEGVQCDEHVCFRFDDDPEFMMGLSEREFLYFVVGGFFVGVLAGLVVWYGTIYVLLLKPNQLTEGVPLVLSLIITCFLGGYIAHKKALRYVSTTKRGKPRGYLFHQFDETLCDHLNKQPRYNTYKGSFEIRR